MGDAEIARLREINEKATPGPWDYLEAKTLTHIEGGEGSPNWGLHIASLPKKAADNAAYIAAFDPPTTRALLDAATALEQARKERDTNEETWRFVDTQRHKDIMGLTEERDAAQQDAKEARALLARSKHSINEQYTELHARIEAMLEKKL